MNDVAGDEEVARLHEVLVPAPAGHLARFATAVGPRNSPLRTGHMAEVTRDTLWLNGTVRHDCCRSPRTAGGTGPPRKEEP